ncbi:hypothetical protein KM043_017528 [Ampulex compressa]|nr:hypothetical protein KM043_017528 [Ampulex compressa]
MLIKRYENKRLLIQAHLDRIFASLSRGSRKAASLGMLLTTFKEVAKYLRSLDKTQDMWDSSLIYQLSIQLDRAIREHWETSISASAEYPTFEQLCIFLTSQVRALERVERAATQTSSTTVIHPSSRRDAKAQQQPPRTSHRILKGISV